MKIIFWKPYLPDPINELMSNLLEVSPYCHLFTVKHKHTHTQNNHLP